jgi:Cdc6-like AAA superfamily ATPase
LDSENRVEIFSRDKEQREIKKFITENIQKKKSALLYLCGHPGTGKTSTLNFVLSDL